MTATELIEPKGIEEVTTSDFYRNFAEWAQAVESGTILLVKGHRRLAELASTIAGQDELAQRQVMREGSPFLHNAQTLQRAILDGIQDPVLVDSTTRARYVDPPALFVGPHIDKFENLPETCLNFWISFSDLSAEESLNFLPTRWHPGVNTSGLMKRGVTLTRKGVLRPVPELLRSATRSGIQAGEFFVFNSGRMVHCSPLTMSGPRLSADIRLVRLNQHHDLLFKEILSFYLGEDVHRFDGSRPPSEIVQELWAEYRGSQRLEVGNRLRALMDDPDRLKAAVASGLEANAAIWLTNQSTRAVQRDLIPRLLSDNPHSVSLRLGVIAGPADIQLKREAARELMALPPESPKPLLPAIRTLGVARALLRVLPGKPASLPVRVAATLLLFALSSRVSQRSRVRTAAEGRLARLLQASMWAGVRT